MTAWICMQILQVMNFHTEITFEGKERKEKRKKKR
jgi:hypothetical protein